MPQRWLGAWSLILGEAERAGSVHTGGDKAQGYIHVYKYLMGKSEDEGVKLFAIVVTDRTRGNGHKLKHMKFWEQENTFLLIVLSNTRMSWQVAEFLSVEIFKAWVDMVLDSLL